MYLGLDLGTSELKALLLAPDHRIVALARVPLTVDRPAPMWSEQAPSQWWAALEAAIAELQRTQAPALSAVRAIGLSGQMHGAVAMDAQDRVLRPAILWNDGRSAAECRELAARVPRLDAIAGNLAMPGFTAPKLLWMHEHEPDLFARIAHVLLPKDWLRFMLSGEFASDMSDASGTLWLDVGARDWSDELLGACGLSRSQMPRLVEGSTPAGRLKPELARRWGMADGAILAGGAGDNAASAVGMGLVDAGQGFVSLGTSGVIFIGGERFEPRPEAAVHAFCHALPGRWHQMSVMLSASSAVSWAARGFGLGNEASLLAAAASLDDGARRRAPLFLPYLSGERSPHNDANARGVLFGLAHEHGPPDIGYAVVEGVSFGLRDGLETLARPAEDLVLVGGGARSTWWAQLLADVLETPLAICDGSEAGGALGAARLAWLSDGGTVAEVCRRPVLRQRFAPDHSRADALRARHASFKALYAGLRPLFGSRG